MDGYCERVGAGLWDEPLNAATNGAFLLASIFLLARLARRPGVAPREAWALPVLLGVIGLCSLAFHVFATPLTGALDSLSILIFILVAVVLLAWRAYGVSPALAWLAAPAFLVFFVAVNGLLALVKPDLTVGGYLPALLGLAGLAVTSRSRLLGAATAVFAVSLTLRTLDRPLCDSLPIGTHWAWHCLNAVVLLLVAMSEERFAERARRG